MEDAVWVVYGLVTGGVVGGGIGLYLHSIGWVPPDER